MNIFNKKSETPASSTVNESRSSSRSEWRSAIARLSVRSIIEDGISSIAYLSARGSLSDCEEAIEDNGVEKSLEKTKSFHWLGKIFSRSKKESSSLMTDDNDASVAGPSTSNALGMYTPEVTPIKGEPRRRSTISTSTPYDAVIARRRILDFSDEWEISVVDSQLEEIRQKFLENCEQMQNSCPFSEAEREDEDAAATAAAIQSAIDAAAVAEQLTRYHNRSRRMRQELIRQERNRHVRRVRVQAELIEQLMESNSRSANTTKANKPKTPKILIRCKEADIKPVTGIRLLRL